MTIRAGLAVALASGVAMIALPGPHAGATGRRYAASGPARLTVSLRRGSVRVPRAFFGLSTEYWTLPIYEQHARVFDRVLAALHVRGDGPMTLRVGGDPASHIRWDPRSLTEPRWLFGLTPGWLTGAGSLVRHAGLRLILDLNTSTDSPSGAAAWARAATVRLPRRAIAGFEVGNEPDSLDRSFRIAALMRGAPPGVVPRPISARSYAREFRAYARALRRAVPRTPLLGPALTSARLAHSWIPRLLVGPHPGLRAISAHSYRFSACARRGAPNDPTVSRLLDLPPTWTRPIAAAARRAHRAGLRFQLTELNSVACGGKPGVSDSFAAALWAPGALFDLMQAGVDATDLHLRAFPVNAPFSFDGNRLAPRPLLYGLALFAQTLGPDARRLALHLRAAHGQRLRAWAVSLRGRTLHVLILNDGGRRARVRLGLPARGAATVLRLLAPSASATSGVTLGGRHLDGSGRWVGRSRTERLRGAGGGYRLELPGASAALVSVRLASG